MEGFTNETRKLAESLEITGVEGKDFMVIVILDLAPSHPVVLIN